VYKEEAPGFRPGPRERETSACIRRHQAFALPPERETLPRGQGGTRLSPCPPRERERERDFRVYKEAPGFRPGPRERERDFRVYKEAPGFRAGPCAILRQIYLNANPSINSHLETVSPTFTTRALLGTEYCTQTLQSYD